MVLLGFDHRSVGGSVLVEHSRRAVLLGARGIALLSIGSANAIVAVIPVPLSRLAVVARLRFLSMQRVEDVGNSQRAILVEHSRWTVSLRARHGFSVYTAHADVAVPLERRPRLASLGFAILDVFDVAQQWVVVEFVRTLDSTVLLDEVGTRHSRAGPVGTVADAETEVAKVSRHLARGANFLVLFDRTQRSAQISWVSTAGPGRANVAGTVAQAPTSVSVLVHNFIGFANFSCRLRADHHFRRILLRAQHHRAAITGTVLGTYAGVAVDFRVGPRLAYLLVSLGCCEENKKLLSESIRNSSMSR